MKGHCMTTKNNAIVQVCRAPGHRSIEIGVGRLNFGVGFDLADWGVAREQFDDVNGEPLHYLQVGPAFRWWSLTKH